MYIVVNIFALFCASQYTFFALQNRCEADEIIAQIFEAKNDWKNVAKNGEISLQFLAPYFA